MEEQIRRVEEQIDSYRDDEERKLLQGKKAQLQDKKAQLRDKKVELRGEKVFFFSFLKVLAGNVVYSNILVLLLKVVALHTRDWTSFIVRNLVLRSIGILQAVF